MWLCCFSGQVVDNGWQLWTKTGSSWIPYTTWGSSKGNDCTRELHSKEQISWWWQKLLSWVGVEIWHQERLGLVCLFQLDINVICFWLLGLMKNCSVINYFWKLECSVTRNVQINPESLELQKGMFSLRELKTALRNNLAP